MPGEEESKAVGSSAHLAASTTTNKNIPSSSNTGKSPTGTITTTTPSTTTATAPIGTRTGSSGNIGGPLLSGSGIGTGTGTIIGPPGGKRGSTSGGIVNVNPNHRLSQVSLKKSDDGSLSVSLLDQDNIIITNNRQPPHHPPHHHYGHHHHQQPDDDEGTDEEEDRSKLELELQFAGIDNETAELDLDEDDNNVDSNGKGSNRTGNGTSRTSPLLPSQQQSQQQGTPGAGNSGGVSPVTSTTGVGGGSGSNVGGPTTGGTTVIMSGSRSSGSVGGGIGIGGSCSGGVVGTGETLDEEEDEDVEGGKTAECTEVIVPIQTLAEKCLFYVTAFFILLAVFSLFAFLFLVPFVIDPAFTTIFMEFDPEPALCVTVSMKPYEGQSKCNWTSCREGCTRELFTCKQIKVNYRIANKGPYPAGEHSPPQHLLSSSSGSSLSRSSRSSGGGSSGSSNSRSDGESGLVWSGQNNYYAAASTSSIAATAYSGGSSSSSSSSISSQNLKSKNQLQLIHYQQNSNNHLLLTNSNNKYNTAAFDPGRRVGREVGGGSGGGSSSSAGHSNKKRKHKLTSELTRSGSGNSGQGEYKWYTDAHLYPNVKGCGYPPVVVCEDFFDKYGVEGTNFSCYYSKVDRGLVVTTYDMNRVITDLIYSMAIPIPCFIISVVYLIFAYFRIYNTDSSSSALRRQSTAGVNQSSTNNNIQAAGNGGGTAGGSMGEPDGDTSLSMDEKTKIIHKSTSRGLNAVDKLVPNSGKGLHHSQVIEMNDLNPQLHNNPADGDLLLPRRNNRAPERNGPANPAAKNKGEMNGQSQSNGSHGHGVIVGGGGGVGVTPTGTTTSTDTGSASTAETEKYLEPGVLPEKSNSLPPIELPPPPPSSSTKKLQEDDDDNHMNSEWADSSSLKRSFQGLRDVSWKPK